MIKKSSKMMKAMQKAYGKKKGENAFYATGKKVSVKGVDPRKMERAADKKFFGSQFSV